jgi:non-heme chloroperoxidase
MMENGYIKSFDGTRIYFESQGSGPAMVFCYGLVCSKLHWSYQMEYFLRRGHRVVWFDYRGHHNSETPKNTKSLTLENVARDGLAVVDSLGIKSAVLLGHSMGVNIVLEMIRLRPKLAAALVLANGSARAPLETMFGTNAAQLFFPLMVAAHGYAPNLVNRVWSKTGKLKLVQFLVGLLGFNPTLSKPEDIAEYVEKTAQLNVSTFLTLLQNYEGYDATSQLTSVAVPALIISGERDIIIPKEAQQIMRQLIPGSQYQEVRSGSHCPQMDLPDLVNLLIARFLGVEKQAQPQRHSKIEQGKSL